jgi:hypothetical protein
MARKNGVFDRKHEYIYMLTLRATLHSYIIFGHPTSNLTPKMVNSSHKRLIGIVKGKGLLL